MPRPPSSFCVDPYVVDTLMQDLVGHDHRPSAFIVYLYFLRRCALQSDGAYRASLAQIALAWLAAQDGVTAPIASATSVAQVEELLGAITLELSAEQLDRLSNAGV